MSFISQLFGRRAGGRKTLTRPPEDRVYIVDATGLVDPRQRAGGQASPRDHFAILRMLAQFAGREAIDIQAVFTGRPLREAGDGAEFKGVRVFYAENVANTHARIKDLIHKLSGRKDVVLLTADVSLEREAAELGTVCMRLSTLRKAFEERDDHDRDRGDRGDRGERGDRGDRDRGNRDRNDRERERQQQRPVPSNKPVNETPAEPAEPTEPKEKENPSVLDLIDPV